jgi:16S rRNA (guanine527-N7)-methyltransferase
MRESFSLVTARAVADLPVLMELCAAFIAPDGIFAALKSHSESEIEASAAAAKTLGLKFEKVINYVIPGGDHRSLVIYRKVSQTPKKYPRKYSDISKKHL